MTKTAKRSKLFVYEVTGRGEVPADMLRYDVAFLRGEVRTTSRGETAATLTSRVAPTVARWATFGFRVTVGTW